MKRIENPHVAAAEGNRRQIKNIPEIIHRRRKTSVLPPAASAIKGITQSPACNYPSTEAPGTYASTEHGLATLFQNAPDSPTPQQFTSDGGSRRKRGITRNCRIWQAVSGQNGKFPDIRIISFPVLRPFSGTCPQAGIRWPPKERKWRLRPAWPTGNGPPTR